MTVFHQVEVQIEEASIRLFISRRLDHQNQLHLTLQIQEASGGGPARLEGLKDVEGYICQSGIQFWFRFTTSAILQLTAIH
jgi:hypothetical protein